MESIFINFNFSFQYLQHAHLILFISQGLPSIYSKISKGNFFYLQRSSLPTTHVMHPYFILWCGTSPLSSTKVTMVTKPMSQSLPTKVQSTLDLPLYRQEAAWKFIIDVLSLKKKCYPLNKKNFKILNYISIKIQPLNHMVIF